MTDTHWPSQERDAGRVGGNYPHTGDATSYGDSATSTDPTTAEARYDLGGTDPDAFPHHEQIIDPPTDYGAGDDRRPVETAKKVAGQAGEAASQVKDAAVQKAGQVKDLTLERAGDVAGVAKDELAKLAGETRTQVEDLWSKVSVQLREQVDAGRAQLAELVGALADELGEMAANSPQSGPVTSLARQAAHRGANLSSWLADSQPNDLVNDIRRFARRRPGVFLGGAVIAGVLVGRLGRGLIAATQNTDSTSEVHARPAAADSAAPATSGATTPPPVSVEEVPNFGAGDPPAQSEFEVGSTSTSPLPDEGKLR